METKKGWFNYVILSKPNLLQFKLSIKMGMKGELNTRLFTSLFYQSCKVIISKAHKNYLFQQPSVNNKIYLCTY